MSRFAPNRFTAGDTRADWAESVPDLVIDKIRLELHRKHQRAYIFYRRHKWGADCYCTSCLTRFQARFDTERITPKDEGLYDLALTIHHNDYYICPLCGAQAKAKAEGYGRSKLWEWNHAAVWSAADDGQTVYVACGDIYGGFSRKEFGSREQISFLEDESKKVSDELQSEQETAEKLSSDLSDAYKQIDGLKKELDELKSKPIETQYISDEKIAEIKKAAAKEAENDLKKEYEARSKDKIRSAVAAEQARFEEENSKLRDTLDRLTAEKSASDDRIKELEQSLQSTEKDSSDKPAVDENLIEFKFYFAETQENLKKFLAVIDKVEDAEQREKFRGAAKKFISAILDDLGG